jgi:hypothetical protein
LRLVEASEPLRARQEAELSAAIDPAGQLPVPQIQSPWTSGALQSFVFPDIFGSDIAVPLTRNLAMGIPAVARARHLVAGSIAKCPLEAYRGDQLLSLADQPGWAYRTDGAVSPFHRMLWTVDDLIFHGWSLWAAQRGTDNALLKGGRIAKDRWRFDSDYGVLVDDGPVSSDEVVLIPGPHEGILNMGNGSKPLRQAMDLEDQASARAAQPAAMLELHHVGETPLAQADIDKLVSSWAAARRGVDGGVAYTSKSVETKELGAAAEHLMTEGRNAAAVNMARMISVPASMIDATADKAALTYETSQGRNGEFIDYGLDLYMSAIAARLSMDDVVPRGQRMAFDTSELRDVAPDPTGPATQD